MTESGWTFGTLKEYVEARLTDKDKRDEQRFDAQEAAVSAAMAAQEKAVGAAMAAADRAVQKAELAADRRAEGQNEFRATLTDQAATFATKDELINRFETVMTAHSALASRMDRRDGSGQGLIAGWGYLVGAVGAGAAVVSFFHH